MLLQESAKRLRDAPIPLKRNSLDFQGFMRIKSAGATWTTGPRSAHQNFLDARSAGCNDVCTQGNNTLMSAATHDAQRCLWRKLTAGAGERPLAKEPAIAILS